MKTCTALIWIFAILWCSGKANMTLAQGINEDFTLQNECVNPSVMLSEPLIHEDLDQRTKWSVSSFTNIFAVTVSKLYCFHGIFKVIRPQRIKHIWYFNGQAVAEIAMNIRKSSVRAWSWLEIPKNSVGRWHVEILDQENELLKRVHFEITDNWKNMPELAVLELPEISVIVNKKK
ncbi:MAG: DUF2914 domain-containing protein [bacterium]